MINQLKFESDNSDNFLMIAFSIICNIIITTTVIPYVCSTCYCSLTHYIHAFTEEYKI